MSLITCIECGKQISDQASSCPHCGAPAYLNIGKKGLSRFRFSRSSTKWETSGIVLIIAGIAIAMATKGGFVGLLIIVGLIALSLAVLSNYRHVNYSG